MDKKKDFVNKNNFRKTLFDFIVSLNSNISKKKIKNDIEKGRVFINGKVELFLKRNICLRDCIEYYFLADKKVFLDIVYEDDDIIAFDKPPYISSEDFSKLAGFELIHRLDFSTSGVLLCCKNKKVKEKMKKIFYEKKVKKTYLTKVLGKLPSINGEINKKLITKNKFGKAFVFLDNKGKEAITRWKLIKELNGISTIECYPLTGRTHQIRVHMRSINHPIIGDYKYCNKESIKIFSPRIMLHSKSISFEIDSKKYNINAKIPKEFEKV